MLSTAPATGIALALALVGLLNALYFTLVTYRLAPPDPRWMPRVCRMDEETCATIVHTRHARVLGLPNSVYGLGWYALAGAWLLGLTDLSRTAMVLAAAGTVLLSAYLAYILLVRLRTPCPLCFLGHGINLALLGLLWLG